jgi:hypothetical protein
MHLKTVQKPTLQQIRTQTKTREGEPISRRLLAEKAELTYDEVYNLDTGGRLSQAKSRRVVWAFNELSGATLTLADLRHKCRS